MRDITLEETLYFNFTTRSFTTGVPTVLAGSPVLSVLESNNATPITAGVSVSVDRATVVGLNQGTVVATAANGYEAGKSYALYISTGTVGGVSVVGEVVAQFTVQSSASFNRLGAPAGASIAADLLVIDNFVDGLETTIGAAGAGLTAVPWNAAWDAEVQSEVNDGLVAYGASTVTTAQVNAECDTAISDAALATAANLATVAGYLDTEIAAILADTNELQTDWVNGGRLDLILDARASQTSVDTVDDFLDTEIAAIKAKTDSLTFTVAGQVDSNILAITGDTGAATKLERMLSGNTTGTVGTGSTTTSIVTSALNPAASVTDQYKGLILKFDDATTTAALRGQGTDITASTSAGVLTCTALTTAPVSGDIFTIS